MPYAILQSTDANMRKQITNALNMAVAQTTLAKNDRLKIPANCQTLVYGSITVDGQLTIDGELRFI